MDEETKNLSYIDLIIANINYIKNLFEIFLNFSRTYNNFSNVMKSVLIKKYPIDAVLKNGNHVKLVNFNATWFLSLIHKQKEFEYNMNEDVVIIDSPSSALENKQKIKIIGGITNGDVINVFLKRDYRDLPVKGKTIVDIGSNIGDSLLFFAIMGADRIIGLEPFPKNYEKAKKNITINNFSDKITVLLAGCSSRSGHIIVDPNYDSGVDSKLGEFNQGVKIPLLTLENIIDNYNIPKDSILKMDCEGCEYESILTASNMIFERFNNIIIEYHHGYKNLKNKLEECGFKVSIKKPTASGFISSYLHVLRKFILSKDSFLKSSNMNNSKINESQNVSKKRDVEYVGMIHATRK
jgi:FkbM family methyltransferase